MQPSLLRKPAFVAFILFDIALVLVLVTLFVARQQTADAVRLRELGVTIYPEPTPLAAFTLTDEQGESFSNAALDGRWSLIFFGFTECPDICPLTMRELAQFYGALQDEDLRRELQVILVSVDPLRDTPQKMAQYLADYDEDFVGLTGDYSAISRLAEELYVVHAMAGTGMEHGDHNGDAMPMPDSGEYLINHSSHIAVINPQGESYAVLRPPHRDRDIAEAIELLLN